MATSYWSVMGRLAVCSLLFLTTACSAVQQFTRGKDQMDNTFETINAEFPHTIHEDDLHKEDLQQCPGLDSQLFQLLQIENPLAYAEQLGIPVMDEKIQILIILQVENTDFLADYEIQIGKQYGNQLQAYVPLSLLCELANLDEVLAIRPVDLAGN